MKRVPKSPLRDILARNMRQLRSNLGLSQEKLAEEANLNRTYLSAIERSEQNISIDNLFKVANGLGVESWELLQDKQNSTDD